MKDKFEEAIRDILPQAIKNYLWQTKVIKKLAEKCNTLHQQALNEEREKLIKKIQKAQKYYENLNRFDYSAGFEKAVHLIWDDIFDAEEIAKGNNTKP